MSQARGGSFLTKTVDVLPYELGEAGKRICASGVNVPPREFRLVALAIDDEARAGDAICDRGGAHHHAEKGGLVHEFRDLPAMERVLGHKFG